MGEGRHTRLPTEVSAASTLKVRRHGLIVTPGMLPAGEGGNINGPSLVRVPDWAPNRLGVYYLYFAHHKGAYIRLAYADFLQGPWRIHPAGALHVDRCDFLREHIASPDVHVDHEARRFVMYFHGPTRADKRQASFVATSPDGLDFAPRPDDLGPSYARFFFHDGWWYGLFGSGHVTLLRSRDGLSKFETGPEILSPGWRGRVAPRHVAVQKQDQFIRIYYTRRGDAPERIFAGTMDLSKDWRQWQIRGGAEVLRPEEVYEGAKLPATPTRKGPANGAENGLRDPAIYMEDGRTWLLYAVAGESGIALAEVRAGDRQGDGVERLAAGVRSRASSVLRRLRRFARQKLPAGLGLPGEGGRGARRIFIAGCARSGTTLSLRLMNCFEDTYTQSKETGHQTLHELDRPESVLVVKRTARSFTGLHKLPASVGLIYCVRHPFDVLTSSHAETRNLRRFHVTPERWLAEYEALLGLRQAQPGRRIFTLRYEDMIADADAVQERLAEAFELAPRMRFSQDPDNPIRATSLQKWKRNEELLAYIYNLPPAFLAAVERFCAEFGYTMPDRPGS